MRSIHRIALAGLVVLVPTVVPASDGPPLGVDIVTTAGVLQAVMSANGRFVAWIQFGSGPTLYVRDRATGTTRTHPNLATVLQDVFAISDDGRYVAYLDGYRGLYAYANRKWADLQTGTIRDLALMGGVVPGQPIVDGYQGVAMSRDGRTVAWTTARYDSSGQVLADVMAITPTSADPFRVGGTCLRPQPLYVAWCLTPGVSGDGQRILYAAGSTTPAALAYYDVATGLREYYPDVQPNVYDANRPEALAPNVDGRVVVTPANLDGRVTSVLFERTARSVDSLMLAAPGYVGRAVSDDGETVLLGNASGYGAGAVLDRRSGLLVELPEQEVYALSAGGRFVLGQQYVDGVPTDLRVTDLDADDDGMLDGWERRFGLDPTNAGDAIADPDGDGVANRDEFAVRSHPTALASATRLFAEGAAGSFFDTVVSVFNPGTLTADAVVRFVGPAGTAGSRIVRLAPLGRADVASCCVGMLEATEFGIIVESTQPVVADRRMTWDRVSGYGSHASTGTSAAATEWFFAEGATVGGFQTFFLIQNPGPAETTASVEFLLADGTSVTRSYAVPGESRRTIWVNQEGAPLAQAEFAAVVRTHAPVVVERAMYRDRPGAFFAAGTNAIGVTAPATRWQFAEGSTGPMFDSFVLAANPGDTPVQVQARFDLVTRSGQSETLLRTYDLAARSRLTIWLDQVDPLLADADVVTTLEATAPVVAERAMWWPGSSTSWAEGHVEFGATGGATRFALADAETDDASQTETFLLVGAADPHAPLPQLRVTVYPANEVPITRDVRATDGRTTIWLRQTFPEATGRFSVVVESVASPTPVAIVVERAIYSRGFAAGAVARATPLPE